MNDPSISVPDRLAIDGGVPMLAERIDFWPPRDATIKAALDAAWQSGDWGRYDGEWTARLRDQLSALHDGAEVMLCASGTIGVELALRGLGLEPGDEVAIAGYDFPGNFRAVEAVGARPLLVDLAPRTWCLSVESFEAAIGESTRAVIVSHLHGGTADMAEIERLCRARGIVIIEDVCQAPGAARNGKMLGTWSDVAIWSFGGSKLLTAGRGGAVISNRPEIMQRIRVYSERGNQAFPLSELQACVLVPQLEKLDERNRIRVRAVERITSDLAPADWLEPLAAAASGETRAYYKTGWLYRPDPACGRSRDAFIAAIRAEGVPFDAGFRGFGQRSSRRCRKPGPLVHSQLAAESTLILHHPILLGSEETLRLVAAAVLKVGATWRLERCRDGSR
ncbi:MAG: L-glutamine:scyllo-inosose aminotransferase [Planctomycetota bacterium]